MSTVVTRAGEVTLLVGHFAISVVTATDAISEGQVIAQGNAELLGEYIIMETMTFMRQITGVNYEYELVRLVVQGTITLLAGFVLVLVAWRYHRQVSVTTIATLTSSFNILQAAVALYLNAMSGLPLQMIRHYEVWHQTQHPPAHLPHPPSLLYSV